MESYNGMNWVKTGTRTIFGVQPLIGLGFTKYNIENPENKYRLINIHILFFTISICTQYELY